MTEAINLTGWEKCKTCGQRTRQQDSYLCRPCDEARIQVAEREVCAKICERRAERVCAKIKALSDTSGCNPTEGMLATEFALRDMASTLRGE